MTTLPKLAKQWAFRSAQSIFQNPESFNVSSNDIDSIVDIIKEEIDFTFNISSSKEELKVEVLKALNSMA